MIQFQNYHCHRDYTNPRISDCAVHVSDYAKRVKELGHQVLSTVEHGWQGNYYEGWKAAQEAGLKLLIGAEAYWVKDRTEKDKTNAHICLLARNENGRRALNDVLSEANLTGFYGRPRVDVPLLLSLPPQDVWVTTACVAYWQYEDIDAITEALAGHFGQSFFLEVQYHHTEKQMALNQHILALHEKLRIPLIMGCDSHYIYPQDARKRSDFLLSKGIDYPEEKGWFMDYPNGDMAYERFAAQGILSHSQIMEAIGNTNVFCGVEEYDPYIFSREIKMPSLYPEWTQEQKNAEYRRLVWEGWEGYKPLADPAREEEYVSEIQKEIAVTEETGMADYFILDHHIVKRGKELGGVLTTTGRGSGVSWITNKLLGFTEVDRVAASVKMYPDRFMSASRILQSGSLPDLDLNVADASPFALAQQDILGEDHAYPMLAYGTMKKSKAWKLYAKSQGIPFEVANAVSDQIKKYEQAVNQADEEERNDIDPLDYIDRKFHQVYQDSAAYLGLIDSWSIAPCSYLLYSGSIRREIGLVRIKDNICCLMDGHWAEECHFLKNDLLTVKTVDLTERIYRRIGIKKHTVPELLAACPPEDPCWEMYRKGATCCLNQVERTGTSARVAKYHPRNISELCAFIAAIRPGFKSMYKVFEERQPFSYGVKAFDGLIQTKEMPYSFVLYQEMEMAAMHYAGIPMDQCYSAIKDIAKKRKEKVLAYKETFIKGFRTDILREGKTEEQAEELAAKLWQIIEDSSRYSFNACVSGSTRLMRSARGRHGFSPTVEGMYRICHDAAYARATGHEALHKKYRRGYGTALSMGEDLRIRKNKIVDIRQAGVQPTYGILTRSGASIVCTGNHKFPTPEGFRFCHELGPGDMLYVAGSYEKDRTHYPFTDGAFESNLPKSGERGFQSNPNGATVQYKAYRAECVASKKRCADCGCEQTAGKRFEVHPKDFDRTNNEPDNFAWLCAGCHKRRHYEKGRTKVYEKGLPVLIDEIVDITPMGEEMTYDVEMKAPNHNFVTDSGLVTSNSHSYCVALDSLYGAWLKAHYPLEFYETALRLYDEKGDKDKMAALKEEAEKYFKIKFPPFRFRQDNRVILADEKTWSITNKLTSIKGFGSALCGTLYRCGQEVGNSFVEVLAWLDRHSVKSAKIEPLIKIGYFDNFGNTAQLLRILSLWDWLGEGKAKNISKDKLSGPMLELVKEFGTDKGVKGNELKSYTITDMPGLLRAVETYVMEKMDLPELDYRVLAQNQMDILGYVDLTTGRKEDRRKLYILEVFAIENRWSQKGGVWKYKVKVKSIGTGNVASLDLDPKLMGAKPIKAGDIIRCTQDPYKDQKGYWHLVNYEYV